VEWLTKSAPVVRVSTPFWAARVGVLEGSVDEKGRRPRIDNIVDMVYTSGTILSSWKGVSLRHP